ncbi:molybdopterin synthase catalytic subunit [Patagioenas fasciata monilis]|uniref:Molybdopterin synthase catalytic subunit n=1 Tax=Patagioenas fasciata monilis TaxID=372326 RepID=A0A1V4KRU3_PATFA|nr:molybdopterin synthase catalytic subunit [Patagioenas fasciata monilis]
MINTYAVNGRKFPKSFSNEVSELVVSPSCGAVSLFIGITRNNFEGKKVIHLEYEAYISMAETEIKKICRNIRQKWPSVKHIAVHHRLGAESLEAVMYCINTLKASVPIWKKEIYEDEYSWKENKECFWLKEKKTDIIYL